MEFPPLVPGVISAVFYWFPVFFHWYLLYFSWFPVYLHRLCIALFSSISTGVSFGVIVCLIIAFATVDVGMEMAVGKAHVIGFMNTFATFSIGRLSVRSHNNILRIEKINSSCGQNYQISLHVIMTMNTESTLVK